MSEHGGEKSSPLKDLLWLLGILAMLFILWVMGGGPERAKKQNEGWIINGPANTAPTKATNTAPNSGQIEVHPVQ